MFSLGQIVLIAIAVTVVAYDVINIQTFSKGAGSVVLTGFLVGLIMKDVKTGLLIGGTMELMGLGVAGYGGASVPNYRVGAAVGTAFTVAMGSGLETALIVGIPTATLGVQLDILAKMLGSFWLHLAQKAAAEGKYKKTYRIIFFSNLFAGRTTLNDTYPVVLFLLLGSTFVENVINVIPDWLTTGLKAAGNVLPALGMAILLKYLPVKNNVQYLILGFVLAVYLNLGILPIALLGTIVAITLYHSYAKSSAKVSTGGIGDE